MITQGFSGIVYGKLTFGLGIAMMSGALCADAGIGNVQEKAFKRFKASNTEMVGSLRSL